MSKGQPPKPMSDNELNELKNLRKKVDYLNDKLNSMSGAQQEEGSEGSGGDSDDEQIAEIQPKKKNIKT